MDEDIVKQVVLSLEKFAVIEGFVRDKSPNHLTNCKEGLEVAYPQAIHYTLGIKYYFASNQFICHHQRTSITYTKPKLEQNLYKYTSFIFYKKLYCDCNLLKCLIHSSLLFCVIYILAYIYLIGT